MGNKRLLIICIFFVVISSSFVVSQNNSGGGSSSNSTSYAGGGSLPVIADNKHLKNLYFSEPVKSIDFLVNKTVFAGKPFPKKIEKLPDKINEIKSKNVYSYFNIESDKKINDNLVSAEIKFNVKRFWIEEKNVDFEDITLLIYDKNGWSDYGIDVEYFGENSEDYFYLAQIPYFSYFAIIAEKMAVIEGDASEKSSVEEIRNITEEKMPEDVPKKKSSVSLVIFGVLFFVVLYLTYEWLMKKKIRKV
ncbi:MAG: PGF-pre-PGF domain-containing protein [Nanoarchaeota archaeon]|nr:PGF-pre-PGF domain-containing protein [Nanoarchaeota archaeon]